MFNSPGEILVCVYIIGLCGQNVLACTVLRGSTPPLSHTYSCIIIIHLLIIIYLLIFIYYYLFIGILLALLYYLFIGIF